MRDWRGPTGFVLALCVGLGFLAAMVAVSFVQTTAITEEGAGLLNTLGGAIVGGVVVWLGGFGAQTNGGNDTRTTTRARKGKHMTTTPTPEPLDPATDPDRSLEDTPQDIPDDDDDDQA